MTTFASVIVLGFLLGMRHATDVDHVLAIATIVSRERMVRLAALIGALWGLGHTLTIMVVGVPIVVLNWVVAPRLGLAMEFVVGLMLMLLGLRNLIVHTHPHGPVPVSHPHGPQDTPLGRLDRTFAGLGVYQAARPIVVGIVHGLAGSAAVALLVLTTIQDPDWAVAYLLVFGFGTVAGMMLITTAIALPFAGTAPSSVNTHRHLRVVTGWLSFGFGLFLAYRIGVADGLFTEAPRWAPH
jgi:high-affinity nickel-transport protein